MTEGPLRAGGGRFAVFSARTEATCVRPEALAVRRKRGVEISGPESKALDRYLHEPFDLVITACDGANESCPVLLGAAERRRWSFPDPSPATGAGEERIGVYRRVRDAISARIEAELLPDPLRSP